MLAINEKSSTGLTAAPDSASGLARELERLSQAATNDRDFLNLFMRFTSDLVNASSVQGLRISETDRPQIFGSVPPSATEPGGEPSFELSKEVLNCSYVTKLPEASDQSSAAFLVPLRDQSAQPHSWLIVSLKAANPFAHAMSRERLELVCALYASMKNGGVVAGNQGDIEIANTLFADGPIDDKLKSFADAACIGLGVNEFIVAEISNASVKSLTFNGVGRPHSTSKTAAGVRKAIETASDESSLADTGSTHVSTRDGWHIAIVRDGTKSVFALATTEGLKHTTTGQQQLGEFAEKFCSALVNCTQETSVRSVLTASLSKLVRKKVAMSAVAGMIVCSLLPVSDELEVPFRVIANDHRIVTAPFDAVIERINVKVGQKVVVGASVLAMLATHDLDLRIASNKAKRESALTERSSARVASDPVRIKRAQLEVDIANAQISLLQYRKSLAQIKPQLSGVVVKSDVENQLGSMVKRGQSLFEIADVTRVKLELYIPDDKVLRIASGQEGRAALAALPGDAIPMSVVKVDPKSKTVGNRSVFVATGFLPQPGPGMRPGMEGLAKIDTGNTLLGWWLIRDAVNYIRHVFWI